MSLFIIFVSFLQGENPAEYLEKRTRKQRDPETILKSFQGDREKLVMLNLFQHLIF